MSIVQPRRAERIANGATQNKDASMTKQSFKDQTDLNRVLDRAGKGASLSHLMNYQGEYGDFSEFSEQYYEDMLNKLSRANTIFYDLPAEIRSEFNNNPGAFFAYVNNPENKDRLAELFPDLAQPGKQLPDVLGAATEALTAAAERILPPDSEAGDSAGDGASESPTGDLGQASA